MSNSLWPNGPQHARPPCLSLSPRVCSDSWPLSWWSHPTTSSFVIPFSSSPQSFQASGSFPMNWLFASGNQSIRASASVLPMNVQGWFPLGLTGLTSLLSKRLSRLFSSIMVQRHQFFGTQSSIMVQPSHLYMTTGKTIALTIRTLVIKMMSLLFNMLSRFVLAFLSRNSHLLILWLQSPSTVILEPEKIKSVTVSIFSPSIAMKWWNWMPWFYLLYSYCSIVNLQCCVCFRFYLLNQVPTL